MSEHAFFQGHRRFKNSEREFKYFKSLVLKEIRPFCQSRSRFSVFEAASGFFIFADEPDQLQIQFGTRTLLRRDAEGHAAAESGPTLLYTFGGAGETVIILYPSSSNISTAREKLLYLGIGKYTGYQLSKRVKSDLNALISYAYVTSLYASPTFSEHLHVWWLRVINPMHVDEKFQPSFLRQLIMKVLITLPFNGLKVFIVTLLGAIILGVAIEYATTANLPNLLRLLKPS